MARATDLGASGSLWSVGSSDETEAGDALPTPTEASKGRQPVRLPPLLGRHAADVAERWAARIRSETLLERRCTSGGWPGTLSEARALVAQQLLPGLGIDCRSELVLVDREQMARFLYHSARSWWKQLEVREVEEIR